MALEIPNEVPAGGPQWLVERRRAAAERLRETGFPTRRTENWRFTPVKPLTSVPFAPAPVDTGAAVRWAVAHLGDAPTHCTLLVNGLQFGPGPNDGGLRSGSGSDCSVEPLSEVLAREPGAVEPYLGKIAAAEHFGALNAVRFEDGVVVRIAGGAILEEPLHLVHVGAPGERPTAAYPRVLVIAGPGSEARLVETYLTHPGERCLTNVVTEVHVGRDAKLDHVRVQEGSDNGFHVATLGVRQERASHYASRVVTLGGALVRLDLGVLLDGEGAECTLDGVYHVGGGDHVDHQTTIDHAEPRCTSHESYRGILDGDGHAVFNGIIVVRRGAQRSSAHQENRNLLLSDRAVVNTKPHLEIDADDVSCSHGATIGALDETALFYLRARGISEAQARDILTFAFVHALLDRIPHPPVRRRVAEALLARLPHGDTIREFV